MALRLSSSSLVARTRTTSARSVSGPIKVAVPRRDVRMCAADSGSKDFDQLLIDVANAFEKSENKPAVIGYSAAAVGALVFAEWFIHLPAIDILLGFPIQLVGLLTLPVLVLRYYVDKKGDPTKDVTEVVTAVTNKLPGLKKE